MFSDADKIEMDLDKFIATVKALVDENVKLSVENGQLRGDYRDLSACHDRLRAVVLDAAASLAVPVTRDAGLVKVKLMEALKER